MCIGTPLQVMAGDDILAWCEADGQREQLDMWLLGPQPPGTWVLAFQGTARQVLTAEEAAAMRRARQALSAAMKGDASLIDDCFADLLARTPELPAHLRPVTHQEP